MRNYRAPRDLLQGRVVLVTGAGDGIGKAAAQAYAKHGATVILLGRTLKKLEAVYDAIEAEDSPQPAIYPMNLEGAIPKDYEDLANVIHSEFGRLDGLLHSAAELGTMTPIAHYDILTWAKVLQVNLTAPFMLTQACLKLLLEAPTSSVVFTLDEVADAGKAYWGAYGVSKGGLQTFMKMLANELESHDTVRVNAICPGPVATRLRLLAYPAEDRSGLRTPTDLMSTYLYLMGDASRDIQGQIVRIQDE